MKGKTVSLIVIGILISFLIVGCGTKKGSEGNLKEELSLSVITTFAGEDGNAQRYKDAISAFEEETGVKINDSSATSDETFKARIKTDFQVGSEPDVLFFFSGADAKKERLFPLIRFGKSIRTMPEIWKMISLFHLLWMERNIQFR